jgi:rhamnose transport system substrate-binding protein
VAGLALAGCTGKAERPYRIGLLARQLGSPVFRVCRRGAEEAAKVLNIELTIDGPTKSDGNRQREILDRWVASSAFDCLCVACTDPDLAAVPLRAALKNGMKVITYDGDTLPDARHHFINPASHDAVAEALVEEMAGALGGRGRVGLLTGGPKADDRGEWAKRVRAYAAQKYPALSLLPEAALGEDRELGVARAAAMIDAKQSVNGILGLTPPSVAAAAEAVRRSKKTGMVRITGVSTPGETREYVKDGTVSAFFFWNPEDLGYLTVLVADRLRKKMMADYGRLEAGRVGVAMMNDRTVLLGPPLRFTRDNIDQYDF